MPNILTPIGQTFTNRPNIAATYGPYASIAAAHAALSDDNLNIIGMTVGIQVDANHIEEYWYQGGTTQAHLVKKQIVEDIPASALAGDIPASKLSSGVQTSLGKADTAYQKPGTGIPASDLAIAVQTSLGKADTAVQPADIAALDGNPTGTSADGHVSVQVTEVDGVVNGVNVTTNDIASASALAGEVSRAQGAEAALDAAKADKATTLYGYGITNAYTKTEVNELVSTPHQNYVTVTDYASLIQQLGSDDTIYRVPSWDGTQADDTKYAEYAWNGSNYVLLSVKSKVNEVFDISEYHSGATYDDLSDALGASGANVPTSVRKGGMSIKFIQSSDNKYVQYRLMAQNFTTDVTQWQGVDDEPTAESENLVKSGGVYDTSNILMRRIGSRVTGTPSANNTSFSFRDFKVIQGKSYYVRYVSGYYSGSKIQIATTGEDITDVPNNGSIVTFTAATTNYAYYYVTDITGKTPTVIDIVEVDTFIDYLIEKDAQLQDNINAEDTKINENIIVKDSPTIGTASFSYDGLRSFMKPGETYYVKALGYIQENLIVKGTSVSIEYNKWVSVVCGNSGNVYIYFSSNVASYTPVDLLVIHENGLKDELSKIWDGFDNIVSEAYGRRFKIANKLFQGTAYNKVQNIYNDSEHPITQGTTLRFRFLNATGLAGSVLLYYNGSSSLELYNGEVTDGKYIDVIAPADITKIGIKIEANNVLAYGFLYLDLTIVDSDSLFGRIVTNKKNIDLNNKNIDLLKSKIETSIIDSSPSPNNSSFKYNMSVVSGKTYYVKKVSGYGTAICTTSSDITNFVDGEFVEYTAATSAVPYTYVGSVDGKTAPVIEICEKDAAIGQILTLQKEIESAGEVTTTRIFVDREDGLTAIADAIDAITDASEKNRYIIHVKGVFHFTDPQTLTMNTGNEYSAIAMKPYIDIEGEGPDNSVLFVDFPANLDDDQSKPVHFHEGKAYNDYQPIYFYGVSGNISNIKIIGKNCRYSFHIERNDPCVGGNIINIENCEVISLGAPDYSSDGRMNCFGTGMTPGQIWNIRNCKLINAINANSFSMHTPLSLFERVGTVNFENCIFKGWISLANYQVENNTVINIVGCSFDKSVPPMIYYSFYNNRTFAKRGDYITQLITANTQKALYRTNIARPNGTGIDIKGAVLRVVSLSSGTTSVVRFDKTKSAFDAIIGDSSIDAVDKTLYGWDTQYGMVYRDGGVGLSGQAFGTLDIDETSSTSTSSLGAKLGDCSTTNKILVVNIDGSDYNVTFNEDYTLKDNAYVISKINDVIGSVATADVFCSAQLYYPNINGLMEVESGDNTAILRGMGVVFDTNGKMVKAKSADGYIDGICLDDTSLGQTGRVISKGYLYYHNTYQWFRTLDSMTSSPATNIGKTLGIDPDNDGKFKLNASPALLRCKANCLEIL